MYLTEIRKAAEYHSSLGRLSLNLKYKNRDNYGNIVATSFELALNLMDEKVTLESNSDITDGAIIKIIEKLVYESHHFGMSVGHDKGFMGSEIENRQYNIYKKVKKFQSHINA
jgi:hypothetical protein